MNEVVKTLFGLTGGLALFLFGMNHMSEALQKAAGEKMKKLLALLTKNPIMGALTGALVTAMLQSSSATTVMVIGFTSAGLMGLPQATSVVFGANIGTTMTAQLVAFDIGDFIYPIIFIGFLMNFIGRRERVKDIGMVIFSFGVLFEGIEIMSSVMKPVASSPFFVDLMDRVKNMPVLGVLLGMCMTLVVQSSSATIAVLQSFARQPLADGVTSIIGLTGAIPILLGDNIGTTITALLASIGQSRNARRTAIAHSIFNITGTLVFLPIITLFAKFVEMISPKGPEVEVISRQIANAHTTFNTVCTLIWLPLLPVMVKIVMHVIPEKGEQAEPEPGAIYLDRHVIAQPEPALYLVRREIQGCMTSVQNLFFNMKEELMDRKSDGSHFMKAYRRTKGIQEDVISYISEMFATGTLSSDQVESASSDLSLITSVDRISERCNDVVRELTQLHQVKGSLTEDAMRELDSCISMASEIYTDSISLLLDADAARAEEIVRKHKKLRKRIRQFNKAHLVRVEKGECADGMTPVFSDMLYNMERIADNCYSIVEEALDRREEGPKLVRMQEDDS